MKKLLACLLVVSLTTPVFAQDDDPTELARKFFEGGKQLYDAGKYGEAIKAFSEAARLSPRASVTFALAQAYRRQYIDDKDPSKLKQAVTLFEEYLLQQPKGGRRDEADRYRADLAVILARVESDMKAQGKAMAEVQRVEETGLIISSNALNAKVSVDGGAFGDAPAIKELGVGTHKIHVEAEGWFPEEVDATVVKDRLIPVIVTLREKPVQLTVRTLDGATIAIDGRPYGEAPTRALGVPSGTHFVSVTKRGHRSWTREITLKRGEAMALDAPLKTTTQRKASYWVVGSAGVLLLAGGVSSVVAYSAQTNAQDLLDKRATGNLTPEELSDYQGFRDRRDTWNDRATFLYVGAGAVAVTGALLYLLDSPRVDLPESRAPLVTPTAAPGELGVAVQSRF